MFRPVFRWLIAAVLVFALLGCVAPKKSARERLLAITYGHTAAGEGPEWIIQNQTIVVVTRGYVHLTRNLSVEEANAITEAIERSGLLSKLGQQVVTPLPADVPVLSDSIYYVFRFTRETGEAGRTRAVVFWNDVDSGAAAVIKAVDAVLPPEYRIKRG